MCFSASASFAASGGLAVLGGASLAIAKKENKLLALVPLMFAVQQGFEGIQWLYLQANTTSMIVGYGFVFFAFLVWPIYVPTFVFILDKKKRNILKYFIALGAVVTLYILIFLIKESLIIRELHSCVSYEFNLPFRTVVLVGYLISIFGPLFLSTLKIFKRIGIVAFVAALGAWLFFAFAFISVWCFFAALVSSLFFFYIRQQK